MNMLGLSPEEMKAPLVQAHLMLEHSQAWTRETSEKDPKEEVETCIAYAQVYATRAIALAVIALVEKMSGKA